jgi:hypothetical protein
MNDAPTAGRPSTANARRIGIQEIPWTAGRVVGITYGRCRWPVGWARLRTQVRLSADVLVTMHAGHGVRRRDVARGHLARADYGRSRGRTVHARMRAVNVSRGHRPRRDSAGGRRADRRPATQQSAAQQPAYRAGTGRPTGPRVAATRVTMAAGTAPQRLAAAGQTEAQAE